MKQQGVILITVLIIIAFVSTIISLMLDKQNANIKKTQQILERSELINYLYSAETWASSVLKEDKIEYDSLDDDWATNMGTLPLPNGSISATIVDEQSKLNLNNIFVMNGEHSVKVNEKFGSFLDRINSIIGQSNMKDSILVYLNSQDKVELFKNKAQLRQVEEIDQEYITSILPYITIVGVELPININTADTVVLQTMHTDISKDIALQITNIRESKIFKNYQDIWNELAKLLPHIKRKVIESTFSKHLVTVRSNYFSLHTTIKINNIMINSETLLYRKDDKINKIYRTFKTIINNQ